MNTVVRIADMTSDTIDKERGRRAPRPQAAPADAPLYRRRAARRLGTGLAFLAEDIVVHVPDGSDLAGERVGKAAVRNHVEMAIAQAHGGSVQVELFERLACDECVALRVKERFCSQTGVVEIQRCNVYRVRAGEIVEVWIFEADQYEVDALFPRGRRGLNGRARSALRHSPAIGRDCSR